MADQVPELEAWIAKARAEGAYLVSFGLGDSKMCNLHGMHEGPSGRTITWQVNARGDSLPEAIVAAIAKVPETKRLRTESENGRLAVARMFSVKPPKAAKPSGPRMTAADLAKLLGPLA